MIDTVSSFSCSFSAACNFARGRWIAERRRPLYSGFKCKQWLSDMWACRLTLRTDFSYEGYRWQPENCEMPDFNGSEFLKRYTSIFSSSLKFLTQVQQREVGKYMSPKFELVAKFGYHHTLIFRRGSSAANIVVPHVL